MRVQSVVGDSWSRTRVAALSDFKRDICPPLITHSACKSYPYGELRISDFSILGHVKLINILDVQNNMLNYNYLFF